MAKVLESDLSISAKMVYCALCTFADSETGDCWPTRETLMQYASIGNTRTFAQAIKDLQDHGIITIKLRRKERGTAFGGRLYHVIPGFDD